MHLEIKNSGQVLDLFEDREEARMTLELLA